MADYKELIVYAIIAIIVVAVVAFLLSGKLSGSSSNISISLSSIGQNSLYPFQTSEFKINVTNLGTSEVQNLLVSFYYNGQQISSNSIIIPPKESIMLIRNYTYLYSGVFNFQVVADPGHILNIPNRTNTQANFTVNIVPAIAPDVYTAIPNNDIANTERFTLNSTGVYSAAEIAQLYNISFFNQLFGPGKQISLKIFENLLPYIGNVDGAYAEYSNNTTAYTVWLQGTVNPSLVKFVISSFGLKTSQEAAASASPITYAQLNNTTSLCALYVGGWTKLITYYNNSEQGTCLNIASKNYTSNETELFVNLRTQNPNLTKYQTDFVYTNTSTLGAALGYSKDNITVTNIFENDFGFFFVSSIKKLALSLNLTKSNNICYGLVYSSNNVNVCSYLVPTTNGSVSIPVGIINTTYITSNYILNLYSFVNQSNLIAAHYNGAELISAIGIPENSLIWTNGFKNGCSFGNDSLGCGFVNFNYTSNEGTLNITNNFNSSIRLNSINCEFANGFPNTTVSKTLDPNSSTQLSFECYTVPTSGSAAVTSYILNLNYTIKNTTEMTHGFFNVTNQAIGN